MTAEDGKEIQMTLEEQRKHEKERERLEKQTASLNEDVEIDEEKVRRRKFAIRREEYRYNR